MAGSRAPDRCGSDQMQKRMVWMVGLVLGCAAWPGTPASAGSTVPVGPSPLRARVVSAGTAGTPDAGGARGTAAAVDQLAMLAVADVQAPARKPRIESMRKAFARALARGWRYIGSARHVAVQVPRPDRSVSAPHGSASVPPGLPPGRASASAGKLRPAALQDFYADGRAEVTVWGWDDGDPATVEGTVYLYSHDTGEEFYFDVQHFAASDTDGWVTWGALIDYRGGWAYRDDDPRQARHGWKIGTEFGDQVELQPAALQLGGPNATISAYSRERCLKRCLDRKMNTVFSATRTGAMTSFIACTRSPATRLGLVAYVSCVGGGSLGGFAIALTNEFVFATSCEDAC